MFRDKQKMKTAMPIIIYTVLIIISGVVLLILLNYYAFSKTIDNAYTNYSNLEVNTVKIALYDSDSITELVEKVKSDPNFLDYSPANVREPYVSLLYKENNSNFKITHKDMGLGYLSSSNDPNVVNFRGQAHMLNDTQSYFNSIELEQGIIKTKVGDSEVIPITLTGNQSKDIKVGQRGIMVFQKGKEFYPAELKFEVVGKAVSPCLLLDDSKFMFPRKEDLVLMPDITDLLPAELFNSNQKEYYLTYKVLPSREELSDLFDEYGFVSHWYEWGNLNHLYYIVETDIIYIFSIVLILILMSFTIFILFKKITNQFRDISDKKIRLFLSLFLTIAITNIIELLALNTLFNSNLFFVNGLNNLDFYSVFDMSLILFIITLVSSIINLFIRRKNSD